MLYATFELIVYTPEGYNVLETILLYIKKYINRLYKTFVDYHCRLFIDFYQ